MDGAVEACDGGDMSRLTFTLLGGFSVRRADGQCVVVPGRKPQGLLAYLALQAGQPQSRERVMALLWGDTTEHQARLSLRQVVFRIRQSLGEDSDALRIGGDTLALDPTAADVDAREFQRLASTGVLESLDQAASLYQGDLLQGLIVDEGPYEEWLMSERLRLQELAVEVFSRLVRREMDSGRDEGAIQAAVKLLALDPLQETAHRTLMRLYDRQGRRAAALRQYQACVDLLQRELGVEPEGETRQLYSEILARHGGLSAVPRTGAQVNATGSTPLPHHHGGIPLVGRREELGRVLAAVPAADSDGGHFILITGEAGIGKTRLVQEVGEALDRRGRRVITAGCYRSEQVLPLRPFVELLRAADVPSRRDSLDALAPALRDEVPRLLPELAEPGRVLASGIPDAGLLFQAVGELFAHVALRQPLALVIDDLHWADETTLRFLGFLGRRLAQVPIVLVATARDDELADTPGLALLLDEVEREGFATRTTLRPLSEAETLDLARALLRGHDRETWVGTIGSRLWATSQGNPFVVVETVRAFQEQGPTASFDRPPLPERVRELTAARLARLAEPARHLVAVAAVAGRALSFGLLADAAGVEERSAAALVEELVRRRIFETAGERLDFTHDRIRQVARESLLAERRAMLHGAVARALERRNVNRLEEVCDQLAYHYGQTGDAERASHYLLVFAQAARTRYALVDALRALDQADTFIDQLTADQRERRRVEAVLERAFVDELAGRVGGLVALLDAHRGRVDALGDPHLASRFYFRLAIRHFYFSGPRLAEQAGRRALAEACRSGDRLTQGLAHYALGHAAYITAPMVGVFHGSQAVEHTQAAQAPLWLGFSRYVLGANCVLVGDFAVAADTLSLAAETGRAVHDPRLESVAMSLIAVIQCYRGDSEGAIASGNQAVALARDVISRAAVTGRRGWVHLELGEYQVAIEDLQRAVEELTHIGIRWSAGRFLAMIAHALERADHHDESVRTAERALGISIEFGDSWAAGWAHRTLGGVAGTDGDPDKAERHMRDALASFTSAGAAFEVARTQLALAEVVGARGDDAGATRLVGEAHCALRKCGLPSLGHPHPDSGPP